MKRSLCLVVLFSTGFLLARAPVGHSQLCGYSFAKLQVLDSRGHAVSGATVELLAALPHRHYLDFDARRGGDGSIDGVNYHLTSDEYAELLKLAIPLKTSKDVCGNPLKLEANSTAIFTRLRASEEVDSRKASSKNFGFCTSENNQSIVFLRASAPGYTSEYYLGTYLGGCGHNYSFVLAKSSKKKR